MVESIEIRSARENNLRDVSLTIPRNRITVFTGVSGSGKSSLVFDTVAAEAQRQLNETFTTFARARLPRYGQPDVDSIEGLSAPVVIDQRRLGGNSRSTLGTVSDINALLRMLFSRAGQPSAGYSNAYSFNDPEGMCSRCHGIGKVVDPDVDRFFDRSKSLNEGALLGPGMAVGQWAWGMYTRSGLFDNDKKLADFSAEEWKLLLHGSGGKLTFDGPSNGGIVTTTYEGVLERFSRLCINRDTGEQSAGNRTTASRFVTVSPCPLCGGTRYNQAVLDSRIGGYNIADLTTVEASELVRLLTDLADLAGRSNQIPALGTLTNLLDSLRQRVAALVDIGVGYLSLDRDTASLSGGESQRIKMVRHLSSSLTEMLYVFDEPSIGLHARDVRQVGELLVKLRDKGNTVLVVEHDPDIVRIADHVVDLGPGAGAHGGEVVYQGDLAGLLATAPPTLTGEHLTRTTEIKAQPRPPTGTMTVVGANTHNLKDVTVALPTGVLTVVTGVAGSGKSTLVHTELLARHPDAVVVDQSAISGSRRSNPATYTGMMDELRRLFARANGVSASLFSFNAAGACPKCHGQGVIFVDLAFMDGLRSVCDVCQGRRFKDEVLAYTYRGGSIGDVLQMTVEEAAAPFTEKKLARILAAVREVGLGYLQLGQPLTTLSGGERQRIKFATELHKAGRLYILDEPTTGLHMSDVAHLMTILDRLVDRGNSVVVIEHNLEVIKRADWIVDLGPDGGHRGGEVLFTGPPAQLLEGHRSVTAEALRQSLRQSSAALSSS